jgi:hypothetical protein
MPSGSSWEVKGIKGAQAYYQDIPREIISNVRKRLPEEFLFIIDEFNTKYG